MSSTTVSSPNRAGPGWGASAPTMTPPRRRRSRSLLALGIALMAVCAAGAVVLWQSAAATTTAAAVTTRVPYGTPITEQVLTPVQVHPDPAVAMLAWDQRAALIGQRAATDLLPGSLLAPNSVGGPDVPAPGRSLVGVAVKPGQMPATPLQPRNLVLLVTTDSPSAASASPDDLAGTAITGVVITTGAPDSSGNTVVDVEVAGSDAAALASRASAGRVAIVLLPRS